MITIKKDSAYPTLRQTHALLGRVKRNIDVLDMCIISSQDIVSIRSLISKTHGVMEALNSLLERDFYDWLKNIQGPE